MDIKRNIKYVVVDLDGTLLNDKHEVSQRNKEAIKKAIETYPKMRSAELEIENQKVLKKTWKI